MTLEYPRSITLEPQSKPPEVSVRVPGSKSLTNRALIVAALARGPSRLEGALDSDDTRVMVEALRQLGLKVDHDSGSATIAIEGCGGRFPTREASLFVANSGTSLRFLTAMLATGLGKFHLDGTPRMRERPVADLLMALNRLGSFAKSDLGTGCPPVTIDADGLDGGIVDVRGDTSSQFLSGLLMALPYARGRTTVEVLGTLVSQPYVSMTIAVMAEFGHRIAQHKFQKFSVEPGSYTGRRFAIEPDASAASYFFAAAAVTGGKVTVEGLGTTSLQGDLAFVDLLEHMGCKVERGGHSTTVNGGPLVGVDVDMNAISDTAMTMAVVALFADGVTRIRNIAHVRHKETDRIAALAAELRKLGAVVDEQPDGLLIVPPEKIRPASIATYDDHRMAMAFAVAGLRAPGITIEDPGCVAKTYPKFWDDWARLFPA
ncbi:MAG: 3-phosphoshikimate 1-carboxyvinyltransferase [Isosphaeraceae bacterium]